MKKITQEKLKAVLEKHKLWIVSEGKEGEQADLSDVDLSGADLREANLNHVDLIRANLSGADLAFSLPQRLLNPCHYSPFVMLYYFFCMCCLQTESSCRLLGFIVSSSGALRQLCSFNNYKQSLKKYVSKRM